MSMYVTNEVYFGTVQIPLDYPYTLYDETEYFRHTRLEAMRKFVFYMKKPNVFQKHNHM